MFPPTFHGCVLLVNPPPRVPPPLPTRAALFQPLPSPFLPPKGREGNVKEVLGIPKLAGYTGNFITLIPRSVIILLQLFKNPRSRGHKRRQRKVARQDFERGKSIIFEVRGEKGCYFVRLLAGINPFLSFELRLSPRCFFLPCTST